MVNLYQNNTNRENSINEQMEKKMKLNGKKREENTFARYQDPGGEFSSSKLKFSLWFSERKLLFYKILKYFLISASTLIWLVSLILWGVYIYGIPQQRILEQQLISTINYEALNAYFAPVSLQIGTASVFPTGISRYSFVAEVFNPNPRYEVYFDYYFSYDGNQTETLRTFLLPGEKRPIGVLGVSEDFVSGAQTVFVGNMEWKRISSHLVSDTRAYQSNRLDFSVSDFQFQSSFYAGTESANAGVIKFNLTNNSAFNYQNADFFAGLYYGGALVGLMPLNFPRFDSLETKKVDLRVFTSNFNVSELVVYPVIDIYKQAD